MPETQLPQLCLAVVASRQSEVRDAQFTHETLPWEFQKNSDNCSDCYAITSKSAESCSKSATFVPRQGFNWKACPGTRQRFRKDAQATVSISSLSLGCRDT